jgi:hypothetical protein
MLKRELGRAEIANVPGLDPSNRTGTEALADAPNPIGTQDD